MISFNEFLDIEEGIGLPLKHKAVNAVKKIARKAVGIDHKRNATIAHHVDQFKVHHRIANDKNASDSIRQLSCITLVSNNTFLKRQNER